MAHTHTIGFLSPKGGVGKTTGTCAVAAILSRFTSRRVLVIDAGGQHNTLLYLDGCHTNGTLTTVDYDAADDEQTLSQLRTIDAGHLFKLIDLPGYAHAQELAAILRGTDGTPVCDLLIIPMTPSQFDIESVTPFVEDVILPSGIPYGVVLSKVPPRSLTEATDLKRQLDADGVTTFDALIRDYRGVRDAQRDRKPITDHGGKHDTVRLAEDDFRALTREIARRLGSRIRIPTRADEAQEARSHG